jgi:hypothetical protein
MFYEDHKRLCEQIAGIKKRVNIFNEEYTEFYIRKDNFHYGIKRVSGFIYNNIHYVPSLTERKEIVAKIEELEERYFKDEVYQYYVNADKIAREKNVSIQISQEHKIDYNIRYFKYIIEVFYIASEFYAILQSTLMISTHSIVSLVGWQDSKAFFEAVSQYRAEVANSISNFRFSELINHFKIVLSFHFTYRIFLNKSDLFYADKLIEFAVSFIFSPYAVNLLIHHTDEKEYKNEEIRNASNFMRKLLVGIYVLTNESMSDKRILPKAKKQILIDRTLI